jgi:predicted heme/steroid binding protein
MKRAFHITSGALSALLLLAAAAPSLGAASDADQGSERVTIESWLLADQVPGDLSGTVTACFRMTGAVEDEGGAPAWDDATYESVPEGGQELAAKCGDWAPIGGFFFGPSASEEDPGRSTVYAVHTMAGQDGLVFITFAGHYDLQTSLQGEGSWVITGGTGAHEGIRGQGTWTADASTFPYIRHTEEGNIQR